jgi:hypothetical protein
MILTEKIGEMNIWEFILSLFIVQLIIALLLAGVQSLINKK